MAKVKAIKDHHGSDGYKFAGQEWEVSDEEAKGLAEAGHVTLEEEEKEEKKAVEKTKEDKTALTTKAAGNPAVTPAPAPAAITTANIKPEEPTK